MYKILFCLIIIGGLLMAYCGCSATPALPPAPAVELSDLMEMPPDKLADRIYSVSEKKFVTFGEMMVRIVNSPVIYVGETHDNVIHHQIQEQVLKEVYTRNGKRRFIALGMEMFQRPYQSFLDNYIAGEISEPELLRRTEYHTRWGFEWSMYQPLVEFARAKKLKITALNAPREITKKVTKTGLKSLTEEELRLIPDKIDTQNKSHRDYVYERFKPHIEMGMFSEKSFETFYESQCLWEDTMADSVAGYFRSLGQDASRGQMVVAVGGGHTMYRFGIPERAKRRSNMDYTSILCVELPEKSGGSESGVAELLEGPGHNPADYLWFTKNVKIDQTRPIIGVYLGETKSGEKGIPLMDVTENGPAEKAGLQKDDIIIMVDNTPINDIVDLKCALAGKQAGEQVKITVRRGQETKEFILLLEKAQN